MSTNIGNKPSKSRPGGLYTVFIIALSLFLLGLTGSFIIHSKNIADNIKEKLEITAILNDSLKHSDIESLKQFFQSKKYIKRIDFISREQAAESLKNDFKEDFLKVLDYNPLYNSFSIFLNANNTDNAQLNKIEADIRSQSGVKEIFYQKSIIELLNNNIQKAIIFCAVLSFLFVFITLTIIDSNIKLTLYADRFLVKNMQLVGATKQFIRNPYMRKGLLYGLISAILALLFVFVFNYVLYLQIPELINYRSAYLYVLLAVSILLFGLLISYISTYRAVTKYLHSKLEDLY